MNRITKFVVLSLIIVWSLAGVANAQDKKLTAWQAAAQSGHDVKKVTPVVTNTAVKPVVDVRMDEQPICGIIESIQQIHPQENMVYVDVTIVRFNDGRILRLAGVPQITLTKGKIYTFVVKKAMNSFGNYPFTSTLAANVCGYDKAK
jgi:hypothetical protein